MFVRTTIGHSHTTIEEMVIKPMTTPVTMAMDIECDHEVHPKIIDCMNKNVNVTMVTDKTIDHQAQVITEIVIIKTVTMVSEL